MNSTLAFPPREENCRLRARNLAAKVGFLSLTDIWPEPERALFWDRLTRLCPRMGSRIYPDDDDTPRLIIMEKGSATLYLRRPRREFVKRVEAETILGEMPLVGISMLGTELEAGRDCQVILLDEPSVEQLLFKTGSPAS